MIVVNNVTYTYKGGKSSALDKVTFDIQKGEVFGLLGPSGAGKTTTQRLIIGLLKGYEGSIKVMDKERSEYNKDFYEEIGVAFDFPNLYLKLNGEDNLKLIKSYYKNNKADVDELLDLVGLYEHRKKKVEGYSKGMKVRLNFIRALINNPKILFFDEPTSGLDPVNAKIIKDTILDLKSKGKTIFLTTHNMMVAQQLCDRIGLMVAGKIVVIDSPKNLLIKHGSKNVKVEYVDEVKGGIVKETQFDLDNIGNDLRFIELLKDKEIRTIHSQEGTLEDVFIKLTGRALR